MGIRNFKMSECKYDLTAAKFDVADGIHKCKIARAQQVQSRNGLDGICIQLRVKDSNGELCKHNIWDGDNGNFDSVLSAFLMAFNIPVSDVYNYFAWENKVGFIEFYHRNRSYKDNNGETREVNECVAKRLCPPEEAHKYLQGVLPPAPQPAPSSYTAQTVSQSKENKESFPDEIPF